MRAIYEPKFAYHYKFPPREIDQMTAGQFWRLCRAVDGIERQLSGG